MTASRSADLPVGSKVRSSSGDLIATRISGGTGEAWIAGGLGTFWNCEIDDWLREGAQVLRVGDGRET